MPEFVQSATEGMWDTNGVEIFATGMHNGDQFSEADLDAIVRTHQEIGGELKPFLKLGHDPKQKLLQKDGYPAAGWLTNLLRKGTKLIADIKAVPEKVKDLIQRGSYGRFSSEIYFNLKHEGKTFPRALKAVALLGGDTPAVKDLDDFIKLSQSDGVYVYTDNRGEVRVYDVEVEGQKESKTAKEGDGMPDVDDKIKDLEKKIASMQSKIDDDEKELKELKSDKTAKAKGHEEDLTKLNAANTEIAALKEAKVKAEADKVASVVQAQAVKDEAEVDAAIKDAVKDGKVAPAKVAILKAILVQPNETGERLVTYTEGEGDKAETRERKFKSGKEIVLALLKGSPKLVEFTEESPGKEKPAPKPPTDGEHDPDAAKVATYIENQKKQGVDVRYVDAVRAVSRLSKEE